MLENDERAEWQRPAELVAALELRAGSSVADVGSGSGYFLPFLSGAVGPEGRVVAQDIDGELVGVLEERIEEEGWHNVTARLGSSDDPGLEARAFDVVLLVNVFHHVPEPEPFLRRLAAALRPDGRIAIVDYPPGDHVPISISGARHRVARQRLEEAAHAVGLTVVREHDFLAYQFFVELAQSSVSNPSEKPHGLPSMNEKP